MAVAIANPTDMDFVAELFSTAVRHDEAAKELWVRLHQDVVELWLVTKPIDLDTEHRFYQISQSLYSAFPPSRVAFHLVNPEMFEPFVLEQIIPAGAERRSLH